MLETQVGGIEGAAEGFVHVFLRHVGIEDGLRTGEGRNGAGKGDAMLAMRMKTPGQVGHGMSQARMHDLRVQPRRLQLVLEHLVMRRRVRQVLVVQPRPFRCPHCGAFQTLLPAPPQPSRKGRARW